ncbi:LacI family DNA-binding transcriptional regulator [Actinoplanes sp. KI2]|uniref:LacI family DNA-binding transcriptional regulator n=1 Tax=Actinoplanes sp. KI2 TaxID=2983315 RepID=UPI0021D572E0|nr:LacI family DNA-binding transcriptional regulator [Actinoplanes sp. KI2]MCU7723095.1 LacI family DNA-binding transcriptional regulator [Actinoplanes sp. KI2]
MKHPHRIREIARQAGLSEATVDRVLHLRGGVRESTAREVHQAIAALGQEQAGARSAYPIDVVFPGPPRLTTVVRQALEAELPDLRPAVLKPRFHFGDADPVAVLERIGRSHSRGVILNAADRPEVVEAVGRLTMPVVTLGADLPASGRVAYVGIDHADAGATAAYLVERWLAERAGDVLLVRGAEPDRGEPDRAAGFRAEMAARAPNRRLLEGDARAILADNPSVRAVYAPAIGGTTAVVDAFAAERRNYDVFVAHGLDAENAGLLRGHRLSAVLHHDLRADLRHACLTILRAQGALAGPIRSRRSSIQMITPFNPPEA